MECSYCGISDKETRIINSKKYGILCRKHYLQIYNHGEIKRTIYDRNEIILHENYAEIILRDKYQNIVGKAIIDIEDVDKVKDLKWHIKTSRNTNYAVYNDKGRSIFIHQIILDYYGEKDIDHINHDGLDSRKENLRIVSHSINIMNQYNEDNGIRKVPSGKYQAHIMVNGKDIHLGTFNTFEEAKQKRVEYEASLL